MPEIVDRIARLGERQELAARIDRATAEFHPADDFGGPARTALAEVRVVERI
jgi:hypothetical protein